MSHSTHEKKSTLEENLIRQGQGVPNEGMANSEYEAKDKLGDLPTSGHNELPSGVGLLNYTDYKSNSSKINGGNMATSFKQSIAS